MINYRLMILRHAKSDWTTTAGSDFDRPLNERGRIEAGYMGQLFAKMQDPPGLWYSSTAVRARQTIEIVTRQLKLSNDIIYNDNLYLCPPETLTMTLQRADDKHQTIAVVGHNPGLEEFITLLVASGAALIKVTTCTLAIIDLSITNWASLEARRGTLRTLISGKFLKKTGMMNG